MYFTYSDRRCCHNISQVCEGGIQDEYVNNGLVMPVEEVNHVNCKGQLVIHQHVSEITRALMNNVKREGTELGRPSHCAKTLVMEAGPEDNVAVDCSEGAFNGDGNDTAVTVCCINWTLCDYENAMNSKEEIGINTIEVTNKELKANFREIRPFVSEDDGSSCNELAFGNFPSDKTYTNCSFHAKMVGNSELAGTYGIGDRTCRQQVRHLTQHPIGRYTVLLEKLNDVFKYESKLMK